MSSLSQRCEIHHFSLFFMEGLWGERNVVDSCVHNVSTINVIDYLIFSCKLAEVFQPNPTPGSSNSPLKSGELDSIFSCVPQPN